MNDDPQNSIYFAVTVAINPRSYITYNEKRVRWQDHFPQDQKDFLDTILYRIEDKNTPTNYSFEQTKNGNYHLHATIKILNQKAFWEVRTRFLEEIQMNMPCSIRNRVFKVKTVYDLEKWDSYVSKFDTERHVSGEPDFDDTDPKDMPTKKLFSDI